MGKIDKITPFVSKTMVDFVENGITAATEAQNAKAENTGSSTMPVVPCQECIKAHK
ncbi:hypothetical protein [Megamonas funiformis]|uniref:hypothetical protein n=1 Tax=Megamonas funiformis TaxID=437897 RepID=UPI0022E820E6|nr:hypothetical protein [Megamonas funiformis]